MNYEITSSIKDKATGKVTGYILGNQTDKPLQPAGDYATRDELGDFVKREFYKKPFINSEFNGICEFNDMLIIGGDTDGLFYKEAGSDEIKRSNITKGQFECIVHVKDDEKGRDELFAVEAPNNEVYPSATMYFIPVVLYRSTDGKHWDAVKDFNDLVCLDKSIAYDGAHGRTFAYDYENHIYIVLAYGHRKPDSEHSRTWMDPSDKLFYYSKDLVNWKFSINTVPTGVETPETYNENHAPKFPVAFDGKLLLIPGAPGTSKYIYVYEWNSTSEEYVLNRFLPVPEYLVDANANGYTDFAHYTGAIATKVNGTWALFVCPHVYDHPENTNFPVKCVYTTDIDSPSAWKNVEILSNSYYKYIRDIEIHDNKIYFCTRKKAGSSTNQLVIQFDIEGSGNALELTNKFDREVPDSGSVKCEGITVTSEGILISGRGGTPANHLYKINGNNIEEVEYDLSEIAEKILVKDDYSDKLAAITAIAKLAANPTTAVIAAKINEILDILKG